MSKIDKKSFWIRFRRGAADAIAAFSIAFLITRSMTDITGGISHNPVTAFFQFALVLIWTMALYGFVKFEFEKRGVVRFLLSPNVRIFKTKDKDE